MSSIVAGSVIELTCEHPDLGTFTFSPIQGEEATLRLGGLMTEDDDEARSGDGRAIDKMHNRNWSLEVPIGWDPRVRDEQADIKKLSGHPKEGDWTIQHVSGAIYAGKGKPKGDHDGNLGTGRMDLKIGGSGEAERVAQ